MAKKTSPKKAYWIGFDLGGTKMLATLFTGAMKPISQKKRRTRANEGQRAGLRRIAETIEMVLDEANVSPAQLAGIGVGCPGPLNLAQGIILEAPNLGWKNVQLKKSLETKFGCSAVIANDVDAGIYGEYVSGAGQKSRCLLGVFPGTGIGGGCVLEGKLIEGGTKSVMEIGHLPMVPNGPLCGCGKRGCLEAVASRLAIASSIATAAHRGQAPWLLQNFGTDMANIKSGAIAKSIAAGDAATKEIVKEAASWVGKAVGIVVNLLAPDTIVLGGGLVEAMSGLYLPEVERSARATVLPSYEKVFKVAAAQLGDNATTTGAAAWAKKTFE